MKRWIQMNYRAINPDKYNGDVNNIFARSSWELCFCKWADTTPEVVRWALEGIVIPYFDPVKNKDRKYYMDFQIMTKQADGSLKITLVEIKPHKQTIKPRANKNKSEKTILTEQQTYITNMAKWAAAKALCNKNNWNFAIITENELYGGLDKGYPAKKAARKR